MTSPNYWAPSTHPSACRCATAPTPLLMSRASRRNCGCQTRSSPAGRRPARQSLKTNDELARSERAEQEMDWLGVFNEHWIPFSAWQGLASVATRSRIMLWGCAWARATGLPRCRNAASLASWCPRRSCAQILELNSQRTRSVGSTLGDETLDDRACDPSSARLATAYQIA